MPCGNAASHGREIAYTDHDHSGDRIATGSVLPGRQGIQAAGHHSELESASINAISSKAKKKTACVRYEGRTNFMISPHIVAIK